MAKQNRKGVGSRLRLLRIERDMNLVRAADAAEISVSLLSAYERSASPINVDNLRKLLDCYGRPELFDELKCESLVERKSIAFEVDREVQPVKAVALMSLLRAADAGLLAESDWERIRHIAEEVNANERG